jgi:predicted outer membrane protein
MENNTAEIRLAELAVQKTQNPRVKEFAEGLLRDHNNAAGRIRELRDARLADSMSPNRKVNTKTATRMATADVKFTPEQQQVLDKLAMLSGVNFDREFIGLMVRHHQHAIRDYQLQSRAHGYSPTGNKQQPTSSQGDLQKPLAPDQKRYSSEELRRDVDTAEFAKAMLPVLERHLDQAEQIQKLLPRT